MILSRPVLTVLTLGVIAACATEGAERPGGGKADDMNDNGTTESCDAPTLAAIPDSGDTSLTALRVGALNRYAEKRLRSRQCDIDDTLRRRDAFVEDRPNIAQFYKLEVGNEATCLNGSFLLAQFNLETNDRYQEMRVQIDAAAEFLKGFHEDSNGVATVLFDKVVICPKQPFGDEFVLSGPTLYINVPFTQLGHIRPFDARELRSDKWTTGEHLARFPNAEGLQLLWPLFDPVGTVRHAQRKGVVSRALGLARNLIDLDGTINGQDFDLDGARNKLRNLITDNVSPTAKTRDDKLLVDEAAADVENADATRLKCLTDAWGRVLSDPERWNAADEAGAARVYKESVANSLSVKVKQRGKIVIGNTHIIRVDLSVFLSSGYKDVERFTEVVQVPQNIEVDQEGFVVVYTVDQVDVNVSVEVDRALPSAGLDEALRSCN